MKYNIYSSLYLLSIHIKSTLDVLDTGSPLNIVRMLKGARGEE